VLGARGADVGRPQVRGDQHSSHRDEVIVDFLEGDPDRPPHHRQGLQRGQYAALHVAGQQDQTGVKTRSTKGGNPDNFNEIRFEDLKGKEELHIQAERDMTTP